MGTQIYLGKPPANIEQWIKNHHGPVVKETTVVKYTAASKLPDWEGDIVGELTDESIPNLSDAEVVEIGSHVTSIGFSAFARCSDLTSVMIPDSVTYIGTAAFVFCSSLTSVTIPDSVTVIYDEMFYDCYELMSVTIGNSVTSIGADVFSGCSGLTSVTIPDRVTNIGTAAFNGCTNLTSVSFSGKTKATVQGMDNYSWELPSGCVLHCTDGDITL